MREVERRFQILLGERGNEIVRSLKLQMTNNIENKRVRERKALAIHITGLIVAGSFLVETARAIGYFQFFCILTRYIVVYSENRNNIQSLY